MRVPPLPGSRRAARPGTGRGLEPVRHLEGERCLAHARLADHGRDRHAHDPAVRFGDEDGDHVVDLVRATAEVACGGGGSRESARPSGTAPPVRRRPPRTASARPPSPGGRPPVAGPSRAGVGGAGRPPGSGRFGPSTPAASASSSCVRTVGTARRALRRGPTSRSAGRPAPRSELARPSPMRSPVPVPAPMLHPDESLRKRPPRSHHRQTPVAGQLPVACLVVGI